MSHRPLQIPLFGLWAIVAALSLIVDVRTYVRTDVRTDVRTYGHTHTHTHTHTHNRFTALLEFVRDYPGEQVPER